MRCPYCHSTSNKVIDSRPIREANAIRRRRECLHCQRRFTTYEQVEETMPLVVKKDGRREPFQRSKLYEGITKACEKRPVSIDAIENFLDSLEREMLESGQREIASTWIGERVMAELHYLIGGDWGPENFPDSHHYVLELQLEGKELDRHGYLVDIVDVEKHLDEVVSRYREKMLNDCTAFAGLNPSIEHFARILAVT